MMATTDADKVRAAADYIERVGLHKGSAFEQDDSATPAPALVERGVKCCTVGAFIGFGVPSRVEWRFSDFLGGYVVPEWNDAPERTADEVVSKLREFADTLDAQPE